MKAHRKKPEVKRKIVTEGNVKGESNVPVNRTTKEKEAITKGTR